MFFFHKRDKIWTQLVFEKLEPTFNGLSNSISVSAIRVYLCLTCDTHFYSLVMGDNVTSSIFEEIANIIGCFILKVFVEVYQR